MPPCQSLYLCDNKFHTEALSELLDSDAKFGFIIMDGNGTLFGSLAGNTREIIYKVSYLQLIEPRLDSRNAG
jgi:peptide chain release factor subunit 1